jgi:hypothetical protein
MIYGITPNGFVKKRLPEIRADIIADMTARYSAIAGRAVVIETNAKSITGPMIDTFAEREAALWDRMEAQYLAMYPQTAEGVSLDNSLGFTGNKRLVAVKTKVFALLRGPVGTVVRKGASATSTHDQQQYTLSADVTISNAAAAAFRIEVGTITAGATYTVTVGAQTLNYVAPAGVTATAILTAITNFLQSARLVATQTTGYVDAYIDGRSVTNVSVSNNLKLGNIESPGVYLSDNAGPYIVDAGEISAAYPGVDGVRNILPGVVGRELETDNEIRKNYDLGPFRLGRGTTDAIRANLYRNVPAITDMVIVENEGNATDVNGIPAGGIEVIVAGGDAQEIRNEIQRVKGSSTTAYGLSAGTAMDSEGTAHPIGITRPIPLYIWVQAKITLKDNSSVSANAFSNMQSNIVKVGSTYGIGKEVVTQQLTVPVLEETDAVKSVDLKVYATTNAAYTPVTSDFVSTNIIPQQRQQPLFAAGRVQVF